MDNPQKRIVGCGENGQRVGRDHPKAKHSDETVRLAHELHDDGWGYKRIAAHLNISVATIQSWLTCRTRSIIPSIWKRITGAEDQRHDRPD